MTAAKSPVRLACAVAIIAGWVSAQPALAAEQAAGVLQSCWAPADLAGRPEEKLSQWTHEQTPLPASKVAAATPSPVMGTVRRVKLPPGKKLVALTFDLCEAASELAGYDGGVIDYLRAQKVKATLFAGGKWLVHHSERGAQLLADPLFEIGSHGWSHANLHLATEPVLDTEIGGGVAAFTEASKALTERACARKSADLTRIPAAPKLFRFPFGTCNPEGLATIAASGQLAIQWDVVTGDPDKHITAEAIARSVLAETKPGSIIVAHANGRGAHTAEALPLFVPQLRARGYEFVTVSELLAAGTPEIAPTCYERHPGDNDRYDLVGLHKEHRPLPAGKAAPPAAWPVQIDKHP
jgi:peptidoglycan/xylan/chitin deacetylase (PgdA/CDA1 family)